jgi:hypothetical protein
MVPVETALRMTLFLVDVHLAAHVAFDPGDRVDDDALAAVVEIETVGGLDDHGLRLLAGGGLRLDLCADLSALTAAWSATPPPTTPAAAMPTCRHWPRRRTA